VSATAAALRAANAIRNASCPHLVVMCPACAAYVINREMGSTELLSAARDAEAALSNGSLYECQVMPEWAQPLVERLRAAIAKTEGR
jgi:hypothetical protein